jgi:23S rRNA (uridine2552-2'-O)-methyltransferase
VAKRPYQPKDHYFKKAKDEGFRARSAFKIEEIAARFSIFHKGQVVLDLGAAPGGFIQVILERVGPKGRVVGGDLAAIRPFTEANVTTAVLDVWAADFDEKLEALEGSPFDVVVSDLAPKTTGVRTTDEARSIRLAEKALRIAERRGRPGGHFIAKLFMGGDFEHFRGEVRAVFEDVKVVRPEATRGASMEVYLVGLRRRAAPPAAVG